MANPEERIDVVNESDEVLSWVSKREAHEKGLLHRTTIGEVIDAEGRWLLVKQSSDRQDAGRYVSPVGGHVQAGETEDEALKREAHEECGLVDFNYKLIGKKIFNRNILNRQENHYFILYEIYSDKELILNEEAVEYKRFTKQELKTAIQNSPEMFGAAFHFIAKAFYPELMN